MSQTLIPTSDVDKSSDLELSSGTTAYNLLNADTSGGYITVVESKATAYAIMHISDPTIPIGDGTWTVNVWAKNTITTHTNPLSCAVYQGGTQIATHTWDMAPTADYTKQTFNLTSGEVANITDPTDLRLKVTVNRNAFGLGYVSYCELVVPDSPCGGHEFGFVF